MNFLLAKTKGRNGTILKVASSATNIIDPPNLETPVGYTPSYKLEDEEWFMLNNFSHSQYANEIIGTQFSSTNYDQITVADFSNIHYLWIRQRGIDYFQKMLPSHIISQRWFKISDEPEIRTDERIIVLSAWADAIYVPNEDCLYFKDLARIKTIFPRIEELFREATNEEVRNFLSSEFLTLTNDYNAEQVKVANRKRIALALETLSRYSDEDKENIFGYIREYCPDLPTNGSSFEIGNEESLKKVLYGIEQRYYTTPLGGEKRLANSVMILS